MNKRYFIILSVLVALIGCFFLFFDKPSNGELYEKCYAKLERQEKFDDIANNDDLNVEVASDFINNEYHYVLTFTSNEKLNNFKVMVVDAEMDDEYYPTFGIFDNLNINLVKDNPGESDTKGVNLVVSNEDEIESFKIYVSYDGFEYYYLLAV
jgi:hypothetical protein